MPSPELDRHLQRFLEEDVQAKREGHTIANVRLEVHALATSVKGINARVAALEADRDDVHDRLDTHGAELATQRVAIVTIKRRLRRDETDEEMDTGQFDLDEIKRELAEVRRRKAESERAKAEDVVWWKRSLIGWVVVAFGFVATQVITVLIALAVFGHK